MKATIKRATSLIPICCLLAGGLGLFPLASLADSDAVKPVSIDQGWELFKSEKYTQAGQVARQLLDHAVEQQNVTAEYDAINLILATRYTQNKYGSDLLEFEYRQETIALKLQDENKLAGVLNNLGYDLLTTGQAPLSEIIPRLERANSIYARLEGHQGRWYTLMNLTWAYRRAGEIERSIQAGEKALAQAKAENDRHAIIETSLNLAETMVSAERLKEADSLVELAGQHTGTAQDRDRYVYDIYAAQHKLHDENASIDREALEEAIAFMQPLEIFYEMLGRSVLAEALLLAGDEKRARAEAEKIIAARNNFVPREAITRAERVIRR